VKKEGKSKKIPKLKKYATNLVLLGPGSSKTYVLLVVVAPLNIQRTLKLGLTLTIFEFPSIECRISSLPSSFHISQDF